MKTKIISTILTIIGIFSLTVSTALPTFAESCSDICNCTGVSEEIKAASGCSGGADKLPTVISNIIKAVIVVLGTVAVIVVVYGGFQYMTSAGDANKAKKARDTILYAAIGLVICVLSFMITDFVINAIKGSQEETPETSIVENSIAFLQESL